MNLADHYYKLYNKAIQQITDKHWQLDPLIDTPNDDRFGLTLLFRPPEHIRKKIIQFEEQLKILEPEQYYYPETDLHVTVLSIVSCYSGFELAKIDKEKYSDTLKEALVNTPPFKITFRGVTASPACIMIQGFFHDNTLNQLRSNVRNAFSQRGLEQSMDQRYLLQAAHSTIVRFRKPLKKNKNLIQLLNESRTIDFGTFTVNEIELVFNDWYQRNEHVSRLSCFKL